LTLSYEIQIWIKLIKKLIPTNSTDNSKTSIAAAGSDIEIAITRSYDFTDERAANFLPDLTPQERQALNGALISAFIRAKKPVTPLKLGIDYSLRQAVTTDLLSIEKLLVENGLPTAGIAEHLSTFCIADTGIVTGVIGLEFSGAAVLLRSLAVSGDRRKQGLGNALVNYALAQARQSRAATAYLLTNTAADFAARSKHQCDPQTNHKYHLIHNIYS